jgi:hypothetical protein
LALVFLAAHNAAHLAGESPAAGIDLFTRVVILDASDGDRGSESSSVKVLTDAGQANLPGRNMK